MRDKDLKENKENAENNNSFDKQKNAPYNFSNSTPIKSKNKKNKKGLGKRKRERGGYRLKDRLKIAQERIDILFNKAKQIAMVGEEDYARYYIHTARRIAQKVNIRIPKKYSMNYCRKCNSYLIPGKTSKVRLNKYNKTIDVICLHCGYIRRYRYK